MYALRRWAGILFLFFLLAHTAWGQTVTTGVTIQQVPSAPASLSGSASSASQINLSWTDASSNELGFKVERKTGSGSYAQIATIAANIASYPDTGLSAGTTYTYRVRAYNSDGDSDYSNEASITTDSSSGSTGGGGGGGGGAPIIYEPSTTKAQIVIKGKAYPSTLVTILKDGQTIATTPSDPQANFNVTISGITAGSYIFGVWAKDSIENRSITQTFPVTVSDGTTVIIGGIFLAPTIDIDKKQVKRGDTVSIFGQTTPSSTIKIIVNSQKELVKQTLSDTRGNYTYTLDTTDLELGDHTVKAKAQDKDDISSLSPSVAFKVGNVTVAKEKNHTAPQVDFSGDGKVNIVDFSMLAYWYKRQSPPAVFDLNGDGKITIIDFSILAYYWTG